MQEFKYIKKLIEKSSNYEIVKMNETSFKKNFISFEGTPKKHPTDKQILVLLTDPFKKDNKFYEFSVDSIGNIEELGTITSNEGQSAYKIRVWVKKGMPALKTEPFIVK